MRHKYTKELIQEAVSHSTTWSDVCRLLGITPATGAQCHLQKRAKEFGVDSSHFLGRAHSRGKSFEKKKAKEYCYPGSKITSHRLKKLLIRDGERSESCEICGLSRWNGEDLPLELDHINSDHSDNRLENLQILCPNCHAVETRKRRSFTGAIRQTQCT